MGKIKKILENELIGGTQSTEIYPVTSTKAVYDTSNKVLDDYIQHLKKTSTFAGIATPTTNPGTPDGPVFYIAGEGTYVNFSNIVIEAGKLGILKWNGTWSKQTIEVGLPPNELNISTLYPTNGKDGTNKYTLAEAIAQVPIEYRTEGLKVTFIDSETSLSETWEYNGGDNFLILGYWTKIPSSVDLVNILDAIVSDTNIPSSLGLIDNTNGQLIIYGNNAYVTDHIELKDNIIIAYNLLTNSRYYAVVAFYDKKGVFIPEYDKYFVNQGSGTEFNINKIIITSLEFPKAKTCRISYNTRGHNTIIKKYNLNTLIKENYESIQDIYNLIKIDNTNDYYTSSFMDDRYLTVTGDISNWGGGKIYKIPKNLIKERIFISNVKAVNNRCMLIGGFKDGDILVQNILTAEANEVKDIYLDKSSIKDEVEYLLISSHTNIPVIYTLGLQLLYNTILNNKEILEDKIISLNNKLLIDIIPNKTYGKYINYRGELLGWSGSSVTELLPLSNRYYYINKIRTIAYELFIVAFYDDEDNIILDYKDFYFDSRSGERDVTDIRIDSSNYPLAKKIRISGKFYDDTIIKASNYQELNERVENIEDKLKNANFSDEQEIYGVGDSIGSQILSSMVDNIGEVDGHKIVNGCIGGEGPTDSLAKNNVIPYIVTPFTVPATTIQSEPMEVYSSRFFQTNIAEDGETISYINTYKVGSNGTGDNPFGEGLNPWDRLECSIGGIKGTLYFKRAAPVRDNNYFIRETAGEEVIFDRPQLVIPTKIQPTQSIWIAFLGTNTGWSPEDTRANFEESADLLVNYYEQLRNHFNHENYVFLGFYMTAYIDQTTGEERIKRWKYFENKMVEKFGKHYLSVRQYLREYGWRDAGYQLGYRLVDDLEGGKGAKKYTCLPEDIEADKQAIKEGRIPWCIVNGPSGVHMLSKPSACVANQVIKRLYELGCINSCPQIDISTIQDAENADINQPDYGN